MNPRRSENLSIRLAIQPQIPPKRIAPKTFQSITLTNQSLIKLRPVRIVNGRYSNGRATPSLAALKVTSS